MSTESRTRAWVEVSGHALRSNMEQVREIVGPEAGILPIVKADGYGLGLARVVQELEPSGPWGFGIETVEEGAELRSLGVARSVLVLAPIPPEEVARAIALRLTLSISSLEALEAVEAGAVNVGREAVVHVEVDTGMGRAGFHWGEAAQWGPRVLELVGDNVRWEGVFTHFHTAAPEESNSISQQADRFAESLETLRALTGDSLRHMCSSAALLRRPDLAGDLVRPGIFLYGGRSWTGLRDPEPVIAVRAKVALCRCVPEGTTVGYGATYRAGRAERWGTLAIGYGDGIPRALGNGGDAIVTGVRVPIIGRISMGMTVVDITDLPRSSCQPGTLATLIGTDGEEQISVEEVAEISGTISHEVLTSLSPRLPRVWL